MSFLSVRKYLAICHAHTVCRSSLLAAAIALTLFVTSGTAPADEAALAARNGHLVFAVGQDPTRQFVDGSFMDFNLFTVSPSGEGLRQVTSARGVEINPAWSPDGRRIAFAGGANLYGALEIEVLDLGSGEVINLTQSPIADDYAPDWSPDGQQIVFASAANAPVAPAYPAEPNYDLYVMNSDGSDLRQLTEASVWESFPAWSPDGKWIAYTEAGSIALIPADGSRQEILVREQEIGQGLFEPQWSPDGRKLLFITAAPEFLGLPIVACACNSDVWVVNRDGTGLRNLTARSGADDYAAAWSPDGKKIAFTSDRSGYRQLYTMNADGSAVARLLDIQLDSGGSGLDWGPRL